MSQLAVQLYTVREHTATAVDFARTLEKVAAIGYPAVQISAVRAMDGDTPEVDAAQARAWLDTNGLRCIATHRSWDALARRTDDEIAFHHTLGCDYVAIGGIPQEYGKEGADGYRRFVDDAAPVIAALKAGGIRFGHHNHAHEFQRQTPRQPGTLFDILIERGGPDYLLEIDLYWAWHGGIDPSALLRRCQGRVPVIHLKDKEVLPSGPEIGAIGEGNLPWDTLIAACKESGVDWYAVEQDVCRRDPFDCLRSSFDYLSGFGL